MKNKNLLNLSYSEIFYQNSKKFFSVKIIKHDIIATAAFAIIILIYGCLLDLMGRDFDFSNNQMMLWSMLPSFYILTLSYVVMQSLLEYLEWDTLKVGEKFYYIAMTLFVIYLLVIGTIFFAVINIFFEENNYLSNFAIYWAIIYALKQMSGLIIK
jgi:hypothetical protein